jgi:hypothetical protein
MSALTVSLSNAGLLAKIAAAKLAAEGALKTGVAQAAAIFEAQAKENAPVLTGRLRDGIHTESVTDTPQVQTQLVTPTVDADNKYGFDPPYARRIEKGFVGTDSLGRHYHQAPQPYMAPAYENKLSEASDAITGAVAAAIAGVA